MPGDDGRGGPVKTTGKVFAVLHGLKELDGAGTSELAAHLGFSKSTVHRHLTTLEAEEYVTRQGDEFNVGLRFFTMGEYARNRYTSYQMARPMVDTLAEETGERSLFVVEEHGMGVYLYRGTGSHAVNTGSRMGTRRHLHAIASGKAILAFLPPERVDEIVAARGLPAKTASTITDRATLDEELAAIRERGVAFNREERIEGLNAVAAPVLGPGDAVIGALAASGPSHRLKGDWFEEEVADMLLGAANELELNIAHGG